MAAVTLEESTFLVAVEWVVRRVEIQNEFLLRRLEGFQEEFYQQRSYPLRVIDKLLVARICVRVLWRKFLTIERAGGGQRLTAISLVPAFLIFNILPARRKGNQRVEPQSVVIVLGFITQCKTETRCRSNIGSVCSTSTASR